VVEHDRERQSQAVVRIEARPAVAVAHLDRPADAEEALRRALLLEAGRLQQEHERRGAAVHDRHFRPREVDVEIVDPEPGERGHQVLDGGHLSPAALERAAQARVAHRLGARADVDRRREIDPAEDDAGVARRGTQRHDDLAAGVQADSGGLDYRLDGPLPEHLSSFRAKR